MLFKRELSSSSSSDDIIIVNPNHASANAMEQQYKVRRSSDDSVRQNEHAYGDAYARQTRHTVRSSSHDVHEFVLANNKVVAHGFLKKVFALLTGSLMLTFLFPCLTTITDVRLWYLDNSWIAWVGMLIYFFTIIPLICKPKLSMKPKVAYPALLILTVALGNSLAYTCAMLSSQVLTLAIGTTIFISFSLMLFACQTKYDFTKFYPFVMVGLLSLFFFGLMSWFIVSDTYQIVYGSIGVVIFSLMLVMDTQMMIKGSRSTMFTPDMWFLAVITLYMDIINIFMFLLRIFSAAED